MALLVLAHPQLEEKDYSWIQAFRSKYDKRYFDVFEPHFTIVFPVYETGEKEFIAHAQKIAKRFKEFYFVLRCAQIVKDSVSDYIDVLLIPEEGYRLFVKLHDALYTGPLEKDLRLDIPFIPHLGIGNNLDAHICKKLADEINLQNIEIVGAVSRLDIASYEGNRIKILKEIFL